jgi:hypothetical protein
MTTSNDSSFETSVYEPRPRMSAAAGRFAIRDAFDGLTTRLEPFVARIELRVRSERCYSVNSSKAEPVPIAVEPGREAEEAATILDRVRAR